MHWETWLTNSQIAVYEDAGFWAGPILHRCIREHAARWPDKVAVVDRTRRLTYAELIGFVDRIAMGLLELGVRPRESVSLQLPNWCEFVLLALATERIGAVVNPISTIMREHELVQMLSAARSRVLAVPAAFRGFRHADLALGLRDSCPDLESVLVVGDEVPTPALGWTEFLQRHQAAKVDRRLLDTLEPNPNDVILLSFTSGTTGEPKGVMHTSHTLGALVKSSVRRQCFSAETVTFMPSPMGHAIGYYWGLRMPLLVGGTVAYQDMWNADDALEIIERERVTFTMGAPAFLSDLVEATSRRKREIGSLQTYLCGGASIPPVLMHKSIQALRCQVAPIWGMTENGVVTACDANTIIEKLVSTDGSPQPEMELKIVGGSGREAEPAEEGRLLVRGPFNFVGYSQGRAFTRSFLDGDGWFDTGDLGYVDRDGYLRITGRTKDLIIRGGENIPVKEIEDALSAHGAIREIALVAVPDERLGERACACVICEPGATIALVDLQDCLAKRKVAKQFWPEFVRIYDELPRTPAGKVQKYVLRDELANA